MRLAWTSSSAVSLRGVLIMGSLLGTVCLCGCPGGLPQQMHRGGQAQGGVDILMPGEHVTEGYSVNITGCEHDAAARELIFSGGEMAAFAGRTQVALRVSSTNPPLRITAFRKDQPLAFNPSACSTATLKVNGSSGELNLTCKDNGKRLDATVRFAQCEAK